jgi:hypothetical protein
VNRKLSQHEMITPVNLTEMVIAALQAQLAVRPLRGRAAGQGSTDCAFVYRNYPLKEGLISARMREGGKRIGVKVYPQRLRHISAM